MTRIGETDLAILLRDMNPQLASGSFVFVSVTEAELKAISPDDIEVMVRESEGITVVMAADQAARYDWAPGNLFARITLQVHSSLAAVGLTAAVASRLAEAGISANVVAGYYHDHIYVADADGKRALKLLAS